MKALIVITLVFAGCYSPSVGDCQYECSSDFNAACPDGMFCNEESFCVNDPGVLCGFDPPFDGNTDIDGSMPPFDVFPPDDSFIPPPDSTMPDGGGPVTDAAVAPETPSIHDTPNDVASEPARVEAESGTATGLAVP